MILTNPSRKKEAFASIEGSAMTRRDDCILDNSVARSDAVMLGKGYKQQRIKSSTPFSFFSPSLTPQSFIFKLNNRRLKNGN